MTKYQKKAARYLACELVSRFRMLVLNCAGYCDYCDGYYTGAGVNLDAVAEWTTGGTVDALLAVFGMDTTCRAFALAINTIFQ